MTDRKPSPLAKYRRAVNVALELPTPAAIARKVMEAADGADNGLRAARYDTDRVTGNGRPASHPERLVERRNRLSDDEGAKDPAKRPLDRAALDNLLAISKASERFVVAIACLLVEVADGDPGDMDDYEWSDAIRDAHLIAELEDGERLQAAIDVGRDVIAPINRAWTAVLDLRAIHQRNQARQPTAWQVYSEEHGATEPCDIHADLRPPIFKPKHGKPPLCKTCSDLARVAGQRPPVELIALLERGTQMEYRKARSRWLEECGVRVDDGRMTG